MTDSRKFGEPADVPVSLPRLACGRLESLDNWGLRHRFAFLAGTAIFLGLLLFLRHPRGLLDANFWAEDGWVWFPDAYRFGVSSLLRPHSGYLQTFSRLVAFFSQPFPLLWAPTLFATAAFLVRLTPPLLLLSRRLDTVWPSLVTRLLFSTVYICLPNSFEGFANVTNSQWHLALGAFLLVTGSPVVTPIRRVCDLMVLALCCLSGPFCLMLLPVTVWVRNQRRSPEARDRLVCVACCAAIQSYLLVLTAVQTRSAASLGADVIALARILAVQVVFGLTLGSHVTSRLARTPLLDSVPFVVSIAAVGLAACSVAAWKGPDLFRKFALFGSLVFAASLLSPVVSLEASAWVVLSEPGAGQRYFLVPMLVLAAAGFVLASYRNHALWVMGRFTCVAMLVGIAGDWPYPSMRRTDFNAQARQFDRSPIGTEMPFQIHPAGVAPMILIKW